MVLNTAGSVVGDRGNAGQVVYGASKAALVGFTRSLAKEVASRNITVNLLVPGNAMVFLYGHFPRCHYCRCGATSVATYNFCLDVRILVLCEHSTFRIVCYLMFASR